MPRWVVSSAKVTHVRRVPSARSGRCVQRRSHRGAGSYDGGVSQDADELPERERARIRSRDRKVSGPRVVVDNPGLKKLAILLAERRRSRAAQPRKRRR